MCVCVYVCLSLSLTLSLPLSLFLFLSLSLSLTLSLPLSLFLFLSLSLSHALSLSLPLCLPGCLRSYVQRLDCLFVFLPVRPSCLVSLVCRFVACLCLPDLRQANFLTCGCSFSLSLNPEKGHPASTEPNKKFVRTWGPGVFGVWFPGCFPGNPAGKPVFVPAPARFFKLTATRPLLPWRSPALEPVHRGGVNRHGLLAADVGPVLQVVVLPLLRTLQVTQNIPSHASHAPPSGESASLGAGCRWIGLEGVVSHVPSTKSQGVKFPNHPIQTTY